MNYVVLHAQCSTVSSGPPYLRVNTVHFSYELFPRYDSGTYIEHTKRILLSARHKVSRYTCACNCIYVHKVEVRPCLRRFPRNSPSWNTVKSCGNNTWWTIKIGRNIHEIQAYFQTCPYIRYGLLLTDFHETFQESMVLCEGVLKRISQKVGKNYAKKQNKLNLAKQCVNP